ncbi:hypothetical protein KY289_020457 [Solanum tuberosum]|nr:hypothetical protein KY289_020457 [Solanum tuberosum]
MYASLEHYSIHRLIADKWTIQHEQNTFTNTIKDKVGATSTLRNEEGQEDDVNLLKMVSEE